MKIATADFGEIEIAPESIIHIPDGLYAFEEIKDYVLLQFNESQAQGPIMCLQSIDGMHPSFTVMDPFYFYPAYNPQIAPEDVAKLKCDDPAGLQFLVMAVIDIDIRNTVINLKSPLVINPENRLAQQVILENGDYQLRYAIFSENGKGE